jgi:hypothetical protein
MPCILAIVATFWQLLYLGDELVAAFGRAEGHLQRQGLQDHAVQRGLGPHGCPQVVVRDNDKAPVFAGCVYVPDIPKDLRDRATRRKAYMRPVMHLLATRYASAG